jgi:hypothetical protein
MMRSTQQGAAGWRCGQSDACLRASPSQSNQHCLTSKEVLAMGLADQRLQWLLRGFPGTACCSLSQPGVACYRRPARGSYFWRCSEKCPAGELEDPEPSHSLRLWYKSPTVLYCLARQIANICRMAEACQAPGLLVLTARVSFQALAILS